MAAEAAGRADAVSRLAVRSHTSWIICASGVEQMTSVLGDVTTKVITLVADTVILSKRPFDYGLDW